MTKTVMIRIPDNIAKEIEKLSDYKGIKFATVITEIVCEHINNKFIK